MDNRCKVCKRLVAEFRCPYEDYENGNCKNFEPRKEEPIDDLSIMRANLNRLNKEHDLLTILKEKPLSPFHKALIMNSTGYGDYMSATNFFEGPVYTYPEYSKLIEWLKGEK